MFISYSPYYNQNHHHFSPAGGYALVFIAQDVRSGEDYALKVCFNAAARHK